MLGASLNPSASIAERGTFAAGIGSAFQVAVAAGDDVDAGVHQRGYDAMAEGP